MADYLWRWNVWLVIPIGGLDTAKRVLPRVWDHPDDAKCYDAIRASADGLEPASHLMAVIPAKRRQAELMYKICGLPGDLDPDWLGTYEPTQADKDTYATIRANSNKFVAAITRRLDAQNHLITQNHPVLFIDSRFAGTQQIPSVTAALNAVNLIRVVPEEVV